MQAPHNRDGHCQYQNIRHDIEDGREACKGREVDTMASRDSPIPEEGNRGALEGTAENGDDAQPHAGNAK